MSKNDNLVATESSSISPLSEFRPPKPAPNSKSGRSGSSPAPLLITESRKEYRRLRSSLRKEIGPQGPIERMYLTDIGHLEWDIRRLRRAKVALLNGAFREVLEFFLPGLLCRPDRDAWEFADKAKEMSFGWFSDPHVQERVAKRLADYGLDVTAIEANVLKRCSSELVEFDRLLASVESRRLRAVRALAEYRGLLRRHIAGDSRADANK